MSQRTRPRFAAATLWLCLLLSGPGPLYADLDEVRAEGILRHLGVPYANFVTGAGDGMDVELMQRFAAHLGVRYRYVETGWATAIGDLTGRRVEARGNSVRTLGEVPIRGDVVANGMTIIPWREQVVAFGSPTFPTQVWLVARAELEMHPIVPAPEPEQDILATRALLGGRTLLGKANTCLDPALYGIQETGAKTVLFEGTLNELVPALLNGESDLSLLDVPDALVALQKWPGRIKVIGPISGTQRMAPAFRPGDRALREAFDRFLAQLKASGDFKHIVLKYYPFTPEFFPEFL